MAMAYGLKEHGASFQSAASLEVALPSSNWSLVTALLGGASVLRRRVENALDAHALLASGLPSRALLFLVERVALLHTAENFENALGMSQRTLQRRAENPDKPLSIEQSGRTWKFAEILSRASVLFGSQDEGEAWLQRPAIGLNQHTPLALLSTTAGSEAVEEYLGRMEHGVYA